ncbi:MAG: hypothetical protein IJ815_00610, partial [Lachnospiraceae bacterium]|nr:hypothetical protein [Lachnospiraceae bacterium]
MENHNVLNIDNIMNGMVNVTQSMYTEAAGIMLPVLQGIKDLANNEVAKELNEAAGAVGDAVEALKILKKCYDIPTTIFMYKFRKYCKGLSEIPLGKRQSYLKRTEEISRKKETLFILNVLNKIEDTDKIYMTVRLLEAKMDGEIDDITYRRLLIMTGDTLYSDLLYMRENISHDNFPINDNA